MIDPATLANPVCGCGSTLCRWWRSTNVTPPGPTDAHIPPGK